MGYHVSERFHKVLGGSHTTAAHLDIYSKGRLIESGVPFNRDGSSVTEDYVTGARRSATIAVPHTKQWLAWLDLSAVELRPYAGLVYGHGTPEMCPMGVFPVLQRPRQLVPRELSLSCVDRWEGINAWGFLTPEWSTRQLAIPATVAKLIQDTSIDVAVQVEATSTVPTPSVLWAPGQGARTQVIADLCQIATAEAFVDRLGAPIVRDRTHLQPTVTLRPGVGGTVVNIVATVDLSKVINAVSVTGTGEAKFDPVLMQISDPHDPAYRDNVGGIRSEAYSSSALTGWFHARQVGADRLRRGRGFARQLTITCVPDYSLDAGDVMNVLWGDGGNELATVQTVTTPLGKGEQSITTVNIRDEDLT